MHNSDSKPHKRILGLVLAAVFAGTTAFAMNVAAPLPITPLTTGTSSTAGIQPMQYHYRTVTIDTAPNGVVTQTIHHPGYSLDRNGAVSPEVHHNYYRVTREGLVEPTNNNDCQDGVCQLPGKSNQ